MKQMKTAAADAATDLPTGLCALAYCSSAVSLPTVADLRHLVARAQERNALEAVTGVLIYSWGSFVQYLEGPAPSVDRVFMRIVRDPMHQHIIEVFREPIVEREFTEWSMAFAPGLLTGEARHFPISRQLEERLRGAEDSISGARHLLRSCWDGGRSDVTGVRL